MPVNGRCFLEFEVEPKTSGTSNYLNVFHHFYRERLIANGLIEESEYFGTRALEPKDFAIKFQNGCHFVLDVSCESLRLAREITNEVYKLHATAFDFLNEKPQTFSLIVHCNCQGEGNQHLVW